MQQPCARVVSFLIVALLAASCGGGGGGGPRNDVVGLPPFQNPPNDPSFAQLWHLLNTGQGGGTANEDVNASPAWTAGRTGAGQRIAIIDDGLDIGHEDLASNVVAGASLDIDDGDDDPTPHPEAGPAAQAHGTACGGLAAAVGHNGVGVTGVAPRAGLVGIRDNSFTDVTYATAVTHNVAQTDVYSMSFGPIDDGGLYPMSAVQLAALEQGIATGRGGLGAIYCVSAGDGGNGLFTDYANLDGAQNFYGMITVGAVNAAGTMADYTELSASTLICAPSNDTTLPLPAVTTTDVMTPNGYEDPPGNYTTTFGGTSSACPLVAGVAALILEEDPSLGWRDVRRILATTARQNDLADGGWVANQAGEMVNHKYGYGVVDADAAVTAAASWVNLPPMVTYTSPVTPVAVALPDAGAQVTNTFAISGSGLVQIDHVTVVLNVVHADFRNLRVTLISPSGTRSDLAVSGAAPAAQPAPTDLLLATNRLIGETTVDGVWTLEVQDQVPGTSGTWTDWRVIIRGH